MIRATIKTVDGDEYPAMFSSWPELSAWMESNRGKYTGIDAKEVKQGGLEYDNAGIDPRYKRMGRG